ncbi:MAG: hypothetical protein WAJ99_17100 [Candidatus Sulfotelmatobacter sp.]
MTSCTLTVASILVYLTTCLGQTGETGNPWVGLIQIDNVLRAAQVSGSLVYSSCGFHKTVPDALPPMRFLSDYSGPPKKVLQKMFEGDLRMRVTQEEGGMIRMVQTDVPTDLLNFKIHHLSFFPSDAAASDAVHGPQMAMLAILQNPEVKAFKKANNIGPFDEGFILPGNCCGGGRVMHGQLDDITVSQALDYVLRTFPGFWVYENCVSPEGERSVYFNFVDVSP